MLLYRKQLVIRINVAKLQCIDPGAENRGSINIFHQFAGKEFQSLIQIE